MSSTCRTMSKTLHGRARSETARGTTRRRPRVPLRRWGTSPELPPRRGGSTVHTERLALAVLHSLEGHPSVTPSAVHQRPFPLSQRSNSGSPRRRWAYRSLSVSADTSASAPAGRVGRAGGPCSTSTSGNRCSTTVTSTTAVGRAARSACRSRHTADLQAGEHVGHGVDRLARISATPSQPGRLQGIRSLTNDGRLCPGRPRPGPGGCASTAGRSPAHCLGLRPLRRIDGFMVTPPPPDETNGVSPKSLSLYIHRVALPPPPYTSQLYKARQHAVSLRHDSPTTPQPRYRA